MAIFRRSRDSLSPAEGITKFWDWWATAQARIDATFGSDLPADLTAEMTQRVSAMHPELGWEISSGPSLTISGAGVGELRGITERWLRAAPESSWRFFAARQADHAMLAEKLVVDDHELDLQYVRLGLHADARRARVDVAAYHPDFLFVAEETRLHVTERVLDWALGEDEVARWVGEVRTVTEAPTDALPADMLPSVVEQVSSPFREPAWLTGEGRTPLGHAARVSVRFPLHRQDHPLCDLHVALSVPYAHSNPDRLPVEPSASALRDLQNTLTQLGDRAVLVAHETGDGRQVFHLYADPDSGVVGELDQLAASWSEGRAKVASTPDPGWQALSPYQP